MGVFMRRSAYFTAGAFLAGVALAAPVAMAQWAAYPLGSQGSYSSEIWALVPGQAGGFVEPTSTTLRGAVWSGSGGAWTDMGPFAAIYGMTATHQVGDVGGTAALWSGTPESRVILHPAGAIGSAAQSLAGGQQSGHAVIGG